MTLVDIGKILSKDFKIIDENEVNAHISEILAHSLSNVPPPMGVCPYNADTEPSGNGRGTKTVKEMSVLVKNIDGSGFYDGAPAGSRTWLEYWKNVTGRSVSRCDACGKAGDLVGAHVKKPGQADGRYYIVPLCRGCNNRTDWFLVNENNMVPSPSRL